MPPGAGQVMDSSKVGPGQNNGEWLRLSVNLSMKALPEGVQIQVSKPWSPPTNVTRPKFDPGPVCGLRRLKCSHHTSFPGSGVHPSTPRLPALIQMGTQSSPTRLRSKEHQTRGLGRHPHSTVSVQIFICTGPSRAFICILSVLLTVNPLLANFRLPLQNPFLATLGG